MMDELLRTRLNYIKNQGLYRNTEVYKPLDAVHADSANNICLVMAANNYLGLTHHPLVCGAAATAAVTYGSSSGGARLTTGNHLLYSCLEEKLADFKNVEAALVFNSGYTANVGTISALVGPDDVIFSDELNHASIIDGCRLAKASVVIYRHCDSDDLAKKLATVSCTGMKYIVTDGIFSMDGDIAPLPEIVMLAEKYSAAVIVDDAHATGVIGPGGRGTAAYYGLEKRIQVQLGTFSKALAAEGGYVAGSSLLKEYILNKARSFIFSTALAPATVAAAQAALDVLVSKPDLVELLKSNTDFLRKELRKAGLAVPSGDTPIIPVIVGEAAIAMEFAARLRTEGIIVSAIRPPTVPPGSCRLRITVSAAHEKRELAAAAAAIIKIASELGIIKGD